MKVPIRLFKYRPVNEHLLDQLCHDRVYFADPATFNDPLDCLPTFSGDGDAVQLEQLLADLIERRQSKVMDEAIRLLRLKADRALARREALTASMIRSAFAKID